MTRSTQALAMLALILSVNISNQLARAGTLYGVASGSDALFAINTTTGLATSIGPLGVNIGGSALAFDPNTGTLYLTDASTDTLYSVNTSNGTATAIGATGFNAIGGLGFDPNTNTLYGSDNTGNQLLTLNTSTGAAVAVGPFGISAGGSGLAFNPNTNTLYLGIGGGTLYDINTSTGAASAVGPFGLNGLFGLAYDPLTDSTYGASNPRLYTVNASTGAATLVGPFVNTSSMNSLAFAYEIPEPTTFALATLSLLVVAYRPRFRRGIFRPHNQSYLVVRASNTKICR